MDAQEIRDVLVQICKRPTMWAGSSDFVHVALFIDGFMYGLDRAGVKDLPITNRGFGIWLGRRLLGGPTNQVWWAVMRDAFPDGREAIASLVPLLDETSRPRLRSATRLAHAAQQRTRTCGKRVTGELLTRLSTRTSAWQKGVSSDPEISPSQT